MSKEVLDIIRKEAVVIEGKRKLSCGRAFQIAGQHGLTLREIGDACNAEGIKIISCQLGCFP